MNARAARGADDDGQDEDEGEDDMDDMEDQGMPHGGRMM